MSYQPVRPARRGTIPIRGVDHHVIRWGPESDDPVLLLHGFADCAATFQFLVDELDASWPLAAVDWRGFGGSARVAGGYWFPDYYADLEALLDTLCPRGPARIVGHSMGANVAMIYAGVRPGRIRTLVNLEGFGLPRTHASQAPGRLAQWLDEIRAPQPAGEYASLGELAARVAKRNPRLPADRAEFVAACWSAPAAGGGVRLLTDPAHRRTNPYLYRRDEMEACWRRIEARVLLVVGQQSELAARLLPEGGVACFRSLVRDLAIEEVAGAGHMLHHEAPRAIARLVEAFVGNSWS
jgi:pimeloyl-ACP methyl ester carboxylesterase